MSNRPHRRRVTPSHLFPTRYALRPDEVFNTLMMRVRHEAHYVELGERMGEVDCTCGYVIPCPYGEPQAAKAIEEHYAAFHVIPDPMGAKYRD